MLQIVPFFKGCDPEGFLSQKGVVLGSERFIPEHGLGYGSKVVRDGIQFEMNPQARNTVRELGEQLSVCFKLLRDRLNGFPGVDVDWRGLVEVSQTELNALSKKSRELGCQASKNIYGNFPIKVSGSTYPLRSAGGHMHFGLLTTHIYDGKGQDERSVLVQALDYLVGNTGVLFDRDPGAKERRRNYGRAGEYRYPKYGMEYRTLSNFWLRNYTLTSLMWGFAEIAVAVVEASIVGEVDYAGSLFDSVEVSRIRQAIDTNDVEIARENFGKIMWLIEDYVSDKAGFVVHKNNLVNVLRLSYNIQEHGIEKAFVVNPTWHWITKKFEDFK